MSENTGNTEKRTTKDKRELTESEKRRAEIFEAREKELLGKGYKRTDLTVSIKKANTVGLLMTLPVAALLFVLDHLITGRSGFAELFINYDHSHIPEMIILVVSFIPLAFLHEGLHGLGWSIGAENGLKDMEFGFIAKLLTPYCTCKVPLTKPVYLFGSLMPMTVLGIGISIAGILTASAITLLVGVIQYIGGAGDILISTMLLFHKTRGKDTVLLDHPYECGLVLFEKE